jgi:nucleoside-diphosphate-sugar epimerase
MRVFVAGATGALGVPLVRRLVATGHEVTGLTRSGTKTTLVRDLGATPAVADALDAAALGAAIAESAPDVVVHALTALPKRGPLRISELAATDRVRIRGTANLIEAAVAAGARRLVAESVALVYGDTGETVATEARAARAPHPALQRSMDAVTSLEDQVLGASRAGRIEGVVLRFGIFYGPGVASTDFMLRTLRRRMFPLLGGGRSVGSWIHVDDAAAATAAALARGRPGEIYNVVDDEPATLRDFVTELTRVVGAPSPFSVPAWVARLLGPLPATLATIRLRVSNAKAKQELGWAPVYPTYREGMRTLAVPSDRRGGSAGPAC